MDTERAITKYIGAALVKTGQHGFLLVFILQAKQALKLKRILVIGGMRNYVVFMG